MKRFALVCLLLSLAVPASAAENAPRRSITVSGQGEVSVRPDRARLHLAVESLKSDPKAAEAEVNRVVRAYVAEARGLGARDSEIQTAAASLTPEYVWDEPARRNRLVGYRARRDLHITVVRLEQLGDFILRGTQAGVTHISPPALEAANAPALGREALVRATQDAREKAVLLAKTLQMTLGSIHSLNAQEAVQPPPMPLMAKGMAMRTEAAFDSGSAAMGVEPGEIKFSATVQADFDLLAP